MQKQCQNMEKLINKLIYKLKNDFSSCCSGGTRRHARQNASLADRFRLCLGTAPYGLQVCSGILLILVVVQGVSNYSEKLFHIIRFGHKAVCRVFEAFHARIIREIATRDDHPDLRIELT